MKPTPKQTRYMGPNARAQSRRDAKPPKRTRIRPISKRRAERLRIYAIVKACHLRLHPTCQKCGYKKGLSIHHVRGRVGALLYDARYFKTLCRLCHTWAHQFPKQAQEMGYLAAPGDWNRA